MLKVGEEDGIIPGDKRIQIGKFQRRHLKIVFQTKRIDRKEEGEYICKEREASKWGMACVKRNRQ